MHHRQFSLATNIDVYFCDLLAYSFGITFVAMAEACHSYARVHIYVFISVDIYKS